MSSQRGNSQGPAYTRKELIEAFDKAKQGTLKYLDQRGNERAGCAAYCFLLGYLQIPQRIPAKWAQTDLNEKKAGTVG